MKDNLSFSKKLVLAIIAVFTMFLTGCAAVAILSEFGRVRGVVTDSSTGDPINGVYVRAYESYYDTDYDFTGSDGSYVLILESGFYDIYFKKDGYYDEKTYDIGVVAPFTRSLDVEMTPIGSSPTPEPSPEPSPRVFAVRASENDHFDVFNVNRSSGELALDEGSNVSTGEDPGAILYLEGKSRIYVINRADRTISVYYSGDGFPEINGSPFSLSNNDGAPTNMVYDTHNDCILLSYAGSSSPGKIEKLSVADSEKVVSLGMLGSSIPDDPLDMAIDHSEKILYVACGTSGKVISYDLENSSVLDSFSLTDPVSLSLHHADDLLLVVGGSSRKITALDVSDPSNISQSGDQTTITSDGDQEVLDSQLDWSKDLFFTLDGGDSGYFIRTWNVGGSPPYNEVQDAITLDDSSSQLFYDRATGFLLASLNGDQGGIAVFDCGYFPDDEVFEVSDSPFYTGSSYYRVDM